MPVVDAGGKLALASVDHRHRRRHLRRRSGNHAVLRLHAGPVLRLGMGQVPAALPRRPASTPSMLVCLLVACAAVLFTGVDPIMVTEYSVVFSAIALPLTYLPILIVANDPGYMGEHVNGRATNMLASVYLVIILAASLAAIPLMIVTGAGQ